MEEASDYSIVWVTAPDLKVARDLVKEVLALHLAACAKIIPGIESHSIRLHGLGPPAKLESFMLHSVTSKSSHCITVSSSVSSRPL